MTHVARFVGHAALLLAFVLLTAVPLDAEEHAEPVTKSAPKNVLLADLGLHVVGVGVQRTVHPALALQLDVDVYTPWTQNIDFLGLSGTANKGDVTGGVVRVRAVWFPAQSAPTGFWLSPFAQEGVVTATRDAKQVQGGAWAVGASAGYAWLLGGWCHIALGVGAQLHGALLPGDVTSASNTPPSFARLYPTLDATLGYAL
jgi:hypothetical protein